MEELIKEVKSLCARSKMCFIPCKLEYLRDVGRVSNVTCIGGKILRIHPSIEIENVYLVAKKKYKEKMERYLQSY